MYEGQPLLHCMGLASTDPPRLPCGSVGPMDVLVNWVPVGGEAWTITKDPFPLLWWRGVHRTQFRKQLSPCLDSSIQAIPHLWFLPSSWTPAHAPSSEAEIQNISDLSFDISFTHPNPGTQGGKGYTSACPPFRYLRHFWKGTHDSRLFPQDILGLQEKYDHTPAGITRGLLFPVKSITLQLSLWKQLHFKKLQMQLWKINLGQNFKRPH